MSNKDIYQPTYSSSRALIIGINTYKKASPLERARNDAEGIARNLIAKYRFPKENVDLLLDDAATRQAIIETYLKLTKEDATSPDDRVVVFFAGHGHTATGARGEVGFLVPVDGSVDEIASLIRWDDLTRNADLIKAKHIFYLMDACYGGLAITRSPAPSSSRFGRDMLKRYSRQVLTAGKADEPVADAGGTRPGHSIFTSYVLDALDGAANTDKGILTANGLMAYVYDRVANDDHSQQTPHYGIIQGDGDLIFDTSPLEEIQKEAKEGEDKDILIKLPPHTVGNQYLASSVANELEEMIPDAKQKIRLNGLISTHLRNVLDRTSQKYFPLQDANPKEADFVDRVKRYGEIIKDIQTITILLGQWADKSQLPLIEKIFSRLTDVPQLQQWNTLWRNLTRYPAFVLMYAGGVSALSARNYDSLAAMFTTPVQVEQPYTGPTRQPVIVPVVDAMTSAIDAFKLLPGHEKYHVARSEFLYKELQPNLEDLLFLGSDYEALFDRFEILLALVFADLHDTNPDHVWGPLGRFAWKHSSRTGVQSPYNELVEEAKKVRNNWPPLKAGLFQGDLNRFLFLAEGYRQRLDKLGWW